MSINIYNIPPGIPFARTLAELLLQETKDSPQKLADYRILLPTRRACRTLQNAFLQQNNGKPLLLPRLQPLGDIEEEELALSFAGSELAEIPPAISQLERQIELTKYILKLPGYAAGPAHALALADMLGRLIDQIAIEGADISKLHTIVPEEFAEHWQISLEFLKALTEYWPAILQQKRLIDVAERRCRLIRALSECWQKQPPAGPVIAAGTTGSIPATAELLKTIASMENGRIILPGLDQLMDEESWQALEDSHPQYGLKRLLDHFGVSRQDVQTIGDASSNECRRFLSTELMRPAATAEKWQDLATNAKAMNMAKEAIKDLKYFICDNERQEAALIALLFREALITKERTAALITPDRNLARRVAAACRRWHIQVDDSAGRPLHQTPVGIYLRLCLQVGLTRLAPVSLLALLKHDLSTAGLENAPFRKAAGRLEVMTLRGVKPKPGFEGIRQNLKDDSLNDLLNRIEPILNPLLESFRTDSPRCFMTLLEMHLSTAEALARSETESGPARLWRGEDGETAAIFLAELREQAAKMPDVTPAEYAEVFERLMAAKSVRPAYGTHPRLMILGQLEARLVDADIFILAGLNEGAWPPDPGHDPWMSRPMRKDFGLPGLERSIGLAAHDFEQAFCAPEVVLTRARRQNGTPAIPSRWLQRLETVLSACKIDIQTLGHHPNLHWVKLLDEPESVKPCVRPQPRPPAEIRPRELSVTGIETWLHDPYQTYAKYILKLRKLEPPEKIPGAAETGSLLHDTLKEFMARWPKDLPANPAAEIMDIAARSRDEKYGDPSLWDYWWPRLARIADWLASHEKAWRQTHTPIGYEIKGKTTIKTKSGDFTLTARADRIDKGPDGKAAIIDYKSGGTYSPGKLKKGELPQLPLESIILRKGGFTDIQAMESAELAYWKLTGAAVPGEIIALDNADLPGLIETVAENLKTMVESFESDDRPYICLTGNATAHRYNDYEHLARIREWSVIGDQAEEAA